MSLSKNNDGEHTFVRRSALQVPAWSEVRVGAAITNSSARFVLPPGATLLELSATEDCFINFGDVTVVATSTIATDGSRLFMGGVQICVVPQDSNGVPFTHLAFLRVDKNGTIQAEKLT